MADFYTIYVVNKGGTTKDFWCFLSTPKMSVSSQIFANSAANLAVDPNAQSTNSFTIPVQYSIGAGASNNAIGLGVKVKSNASADVELGDVWNAHYADAPPPKGPKLVQGDSGITKTIRVITSQFDQVANNKAKWHQSQSFGIETAQGFMGVTWEPDPDDDTTITPVMSFYIATGKFTRYALADMDTVSHSSAKIPLTAFSNANEAWVVLDGSGHWHVSDTDPSLSLANQLDKMLESHQHLCATHAQLTQMLGGSTSAAAANEDQIESVKWGKVQAEADDEGGVITVTGTMVVAVAVTMTTFVCSGTSFTATGSNDGGYTWSFIYTGQKTLETLKHILIEGAKILYK